MAYQPKSYRKFVATAATATLVASAVAPAALAASSFTDVAPKYKEAVDYLFDNGITQGKTEELFGTHQNITRGELAIWLTRALGLETAGAAPSGFEDTAGTYYDAHVAVLKEEGILDGLSADEFGVNAFVTRGQMAKLLSNAYGLTSEEEAPFEDMGQWAPYINGLYAYEITSGKTEELFGTGEAITRGDLALFMFRAEGTVLVDEAPVFNYEGEETIALAYGAEFTAPVVTAEDDIDEEVEVVSVITDAAGNELQAIDTKKPGTYTITYTAEDSAENVSELVLTVVVAEAVTPAVESVSAINANELEIKFNKPVKASTVVTPAGVTGAGTLVDGLLKVDGNVGDALTASLSADGKTLTVNSAWEGTHSIEVLPNVAEDLDGNAVGHFTDVFTFDDTVRADIKEVVYLDNATAEIHLTEPVATIGTVTAKYTDSTLPAITVAAPNGSDTTHQVNATLTSPKVITVDLSDAQLAGDKNIELLISELTDLATPVANKSVPKTVVVSKSTADKTKPVITSVTNSGYNGTVTTFDIKLSEATNTTSIAAGAGVTINGLAVTATRDANDKTVLHASVTGKLEGSNLLYVPADVVVDLSGNGNAVTSAYYTLTLDKAAPTVVSSAVERVNGDEHLVVTLNEQVTLDTAKALTFSWTDQYGVTHNFVTADATGSSLVDPNANGTSNKVKINLDTTFAGSLNGGAATTLDLADNKAYKVSFAAGFVKDTFNNTSAAVSNLAFSTSTVDTGVGAQSSVSTSAINPGVVAVTFSKPVNAAAAVSTSYYEVEGATIKEAKLVSNGPAGAVVHLVLNDNTVETTGYFNVTVKPVPTYNTEDKANNVTVSSLQLVENVRSVVSSKTVTNLIADEFSVNVTFDDATVADAGTVEDFELYVDGVATGEVLAVTVTAGQATISWNDATVAGTSVKDLTTAASIKLVALDTLDIKDTNNNIVNVNDIVIK